MINLLMKLILPLFQLKVLILYLRENPLMNQWFVTGPFVTNTEGEMKQAMLDYQNGKMGQLE